MTQSDILAAYKQGRKDALAGRSRNAPRYSDKLRDASWDRGFTDQLRVMQRTRPPAARREK